MQQNPQFLRTDKAIKQALITLLKIKPFENKRIVVGNRFRGTGLPIAEQIFRFQSDIVSCCASRQQDDVQYRERKLIFIRITQTHFLFFLRRRFCAGKTAHSPYAGLIFIE